MFLTNPECHTLLAITNLSLWRINLHCKNFEEFCSNKTVPPTTRQKTEYILKICLTEYSQIFKYNLACQISWLYLIEFYLRGYPQHMVYQQESFKNGDHLDRIISEVCKNIILEWREGGYVEAQATHHSTCRGFGGRNENLIVLFLCMFTPYMCFNLT